MSVTVVCPGSFDPITLGHLDVIERAARRFDEVVVAVIDNPNKQGLFTIDERVALIEAEVSGHPNVRVDRFQGLLVEYCRAIGVGLVCKGIRGVADVEYELQMARMNERIGAVDTLFIGGDPSLAHISSSLVKEITRLGGEVSEAVPPRVAEELRRRLT